MIQVTGSRQICPKSPQSLHMAISRMLFNSDFNVCITQKEHFMTHLLRYSLLIFVNVAILIMFRVMFE